MNKEKCLKHFSSFIERDWCGITENCTEEAYKEFAKKHEYAIFKPLDLGGGKGIKILKLDKFLDGAYSYCHEKCYLMEELIVQENSLNELYPHSINTIRMVTLDGKLIAAVLRIGRNGSGIDNIAAGGITAGVDIESRIVMNTGKTYLDEEFVRHPDTGVAIPGFVIPKWDECVEYVEKAIEMCPGIPCIGWDIAVTKNGPTIVEVNEGTEIEVIEVPLEKGFRRIMQGK